MKPSTITLKDPIGYFALPISTHRGPTFTKVQSKSLYKQDSVATSWALQVPCVQGPGGKRRVIRVTDLTSGILRIAITQ